MRKKCTRCGMIRAEKDLVHLDSGEYLCFHCWNELQSTKKKEDKTK